VTAEGVRVINAFEFTLFEVEVPSAERGGPRRRARGGHRVARVPLDPARVVA
jgi:hypothetical protein